MGHEMAADSERILRGAADRVAQLRNLVGYEREVLEAARRRLDSLPQAARRAPQATNIDVLEACVHDLETLLGLWEHEEERRSSGSTE